MLGQRRVNIAQPGDVPSALREVAELDQEGDEEEAGGDGVIGNDYTELNQSVHINSSDYTFADGSARSLKAFEDLLKEWRDKGDLDGLVLGN